jgi:hypothetical protein
MDGFCVRVGGWNVIEGVSMIDSPLGRMMPVAFQQVQLYGSLCDDMEFKKDSPEPNAEFKKSTDAAEKNKKDVLLSRKTEQPSPADEKKIIWLSETSFSVLEGLACLMIRFIRFR